MLKFIELDGKVPKHDFNTFSTDHKNYDDAGVILNKNIVVVDFDNGEAAKIGERIYQKHPTLKVKTTRGMHLYYQKPKFVFIKNWTNKLTNAGIPVDYKYGPKSQGVIKQSGKMRGMEHSELLGAWDELPMIPPELYPSKMNQVLLNLKDGQGRNSFLYAHLLAIREMYHKNMTEADITHIAELIDKHIFAEPLDVKSNELQTLVENVLSKNIEGSNNVDYLDPKNPVGMSVAFTDKYKIKYYNQNLYFKTDSGEWITDNNKLLRQMDKHIKLKPRQQNEVLKRLETDAELVEEDIFPIRFNNGIVLDTECDIVPVDSEFTPFNLDVEYNEDAYDEHVDNFLNFVTKNRQDLRTVLEEMFGHILMTHSFPHKAFFLTGESGSNGKSTLLEMLNNFVGDLGHTLSLEDFNEPFQIATLDGKLANIGDDIDAAYLEKSKNFKTLVSGNTISARKLYGEPFKLKNKASLIFTCNEMPTFKDKSGGIARRLVIIPFDNKVAEADPQIDEKLSTDNARSHLLNLAIAGMQRILKNGGISYSQTIEDATNKYLTENDSVLSYLYDRSIDGKSIEGQTIDTVYLQYQNYCEDNGLKPLGKTAMSRRINAAGYSSERKTIKGKKRTVYVQVS